MKDQADIRASVIEAVCNILGDFRSAANWLYIRFLLATDTLSAQNANLENFLEACDLLKNLNPSGRNFWEIVKHSGLRC